MKIHAISDLHGYQPKAPNGDVLVIAGDCTARDTPKCWNKFAQYVNGLEYRHIILVGGNHDGALQHHKDETLALFNDKVIYLEDTAITLDGIKYYGSPWTQTFFDWHFMKNPIQMRDFWDQIPIDTDVLITHGPPHGILDKGINGRFGDKWLAYNINRVKPMVHIFGHIHESRGEDEDAWDISGKRTTKYYNVSYCDEKYQETGKFVKIHAVRPKSHDHRPTVIEQRNLDD